MEPGVAVYNLIYYGRDSRGTGPRAPHHRPPGGERQAQSQGHHTIDHLEEKERGRHKAKDIIPSIAWRIEANTKPKTSHH